MAEPLAVARHGDDELALLPAMANRHGLITGATGTGKTISLQVLAEGFSRIGVPVFMADVKGDLTGIAFPGALSPKLEERLAKLGLPTPAWGGSPVALWDVWAEQGHPVRATVSDMGPLLFARLLNLNETQEGVLAIAFKVADDNGHLLLDLKDLRAMLQFVGDNAPAIKTQYGNVSPASIGAIQRGLLQLDEQGGDRFFGEPMLNIDDLIQTDAKGRGVVNILAADKLMSAPRLYGTFLLWLLAELYENLPEVGDRDKPKLVFFFDEAHLLFSEAPSALLERIEQVVRLIRSKGVGVFFITQNPLDVPDKVLGQLGNRIQHALRAFTPRDQKAVRSVADTMRPNPKLDIGKAILELATGEALVSLLDAKGAPGVTERAWMLAPGSRIGPVTPDERRKLIAESLVAGQYEKTVDRESAFERLKARAQGSTTPPGTVPAGQPTTTAPSGGGMMGGISDILFGSTGPRGGKREGMVDALAKSAARTMGSSIAREITRGVLGSLLGGETPMNATLRFAFAATTAAVVAACGSPQRDPVPVTPPAEVAKAPVARTPVAPGTTPAPSPGTNLPSSKLDPSTFPAGAIYVCASGAPSDRKLIAIAFDEKVGKLCRTHPEMGPCQYERNICRGSGGRVYAPDGSEITMVHEAEYDKKVMRVRFKAN